MEDYISVKELRKELKQRGIEVSLPLLYRYVYRLPKDMVKEVKKVKRRYWKVSRKAVELIVNGEI